MRVVGLFCSSMGFKTMYFSTHAYISKRPTPQEMQITSTAAIPTWLYARRSGDEEHEHVCFSLKPCRACCDGNSSPRRRHRVCLRSGVNRTMQVFTDGLEVMSNMGAVVNSLFSRVQKNLVQTM